MLKHKFDHWFEKFTDVMIIKNAKDRKGAAWHLLLGLIFQLLLGIFVFSFAHLAKA